MTFAQVHNGGAFTRTARASGSNNATAGGAGDAVQVNTDWHGRRGNVAASLNPKGIVNSAKLVINYSAVLGQGATLKFGVNFQDALDINGTGAAAYAETVPLETVATGGSGGTTESGTKEYDIDLAGAREFIRAQVTPDLSSASGDTVQWSAVWLFFGDQRGLPTKSTVNLSSADAI